MGGDGHVFTRENGEPWHPDRVYDLFRQAVAATHLPRICVHDLRHTNTTLALQTSINPKVVQEWLGHKSIKHTMDTYSHVLEVLHESAADLIENLIPSPAGGAEPAAPES